MRHLGFKKSIKLLHKDETSRLNKEKKRELAPKNETSRVIGKKIIKVLHKDETSRLKKILLPKMRHLYRLNKEKKRKLMSKNEPLA